MTALPLLAPATFDGVTFAARPDLLLAPVRRVGEALGLSVAYEAGRVVVAGRTLDEEGRLVPLRALTGWGVVVSWDGAAGRARLDRAGRSLFVRRGRKRATIDKSRQELSAYQGDLLVLQSRVSTGRAGKRTPNGTFRTGPYKARMHYSSLYNGAAMPYSVQIVGDIFVHGYANVPGHPASHGCIRLPTDGTARFFYEWIERDTPVHIEGRWRE
jgi:hypothetical protein